MTDGSERMDDEQDDEDEEEVAAMPPMPPKVCPRSCHWLPGCSVNMIGKRQVLLLHPGLTQAEF